MSLFVLTSVMAVDSLHLLINAVPLFAAFQVESTALLLQVGEVNRFFQISLRMAS